MEGIEAPFSLHSAAYPVHGYPRAPDVFSAKTGCPRRFFRMSKIDCETAFAWLSCIPRNPRDRW